jgi:hypothetical protein
MTPHCSRFEASRPPLANPPMPRHDEYDVEDVECDHGQRLPQMQLAVDDEAHAECCGHQEEADIADEALARHLKWSDERHRARHDCSNEAGGANQLSHCQTRCMCAEGGECREDVGAAIPECQQSDTRQTLAHPQHARDGVEVDAEEVARCDANGAEEHGQPQRHDGECNGFRLGHAAVVEREIRYNARLLVGAVGENKGALVFGVVDESALELLDGPIQVQTVPTSSSCTMSSLFTKALPAPPTCER